MKIIYFEDIEMASAVTYFFSYRIVYMLIERFQFNNFSHKQQ